ncbi:MAG TPA: hypothetical protein VKC53_03080 [Patescibacteria group bacterium]|nr:hypothetical protein [Patescibacteria group bacterium]
MSAEQNKQVKRKKSEFYISAVESAAGSIAMHFLRENKEKGRPLLIPSLGIQINADGTQEKISEITKLDPAK